MAPPRQRPAPATAAAAAATSAAANAVIPDDSRSEASSTRERQGTTKGRKPAATSSAAANTTVAGMNAALKEGKSPAADQRMDESGSVESQASINWSTMPLSVLHEYRYAYNLSCPSAFSSQINSILLSQGAGLRSATAISIRRRQLLQQQASDRQHQDMQVDTDMDISSRQEGPTMRSDNVLHRLSAPAQGRVSKAQLASAVRKHFNNTAISEQDAIARFLYKVNEERRGKEFRLRFQP
ncbi:hypothetical protein McanMca71_004342 [Microsporum canis]|uniref:Histone deacetylase complex subunit SAP30 Sin3 binding domain-containing protein n=1 Tax=Arthroderma otae (strain ATCC MYA-4605 / CBS 113480) TaxID=554155 RepID=C5FFK7_ARTOC|nr:conserved hypothetical protein [Microsporum canis CBS 113480]EEQ29454.1 conserved hypothetical protein [Microsporum canis CBS 113480]